MFYPVRLHVMSCDLKKMAVLSDVLDYLSLQNVVLFFVLAFVCGVLSVS